MFEFLPPTSLPLLGEETLANFDFDYLMLGLPFVKECTSP